ncbi:MAG TPA: hypothetical protein EYP23_00395 [Thermoplasmata archaeon]|nr:hypothetical protein [Thermoplasmata archaeon]
MGSNLLKKDLVFTLIILFIGTSVFPIVHGNIVGFGSENNWSSINTNDDRKILQEIEGTENKMLVVDEIIGERQVKYWEHVINDICIKNDFILLHQDIESGEILQYERCWTDIQLPLYDSEEEFEPNDYFWKQKIIFLDDGDLTYFYTVFDSQEYPLLCWEVRHTDGTTILYDLNGNQIGHGIPAPSSNGFSLSGFHETSYPDPWIDFRLNADSWFSRWCDETVSISLPTPAVISSYVSDPDFEFFFELAHGASTYFQANWYGSYYTSSDVAEDMDDRQPMRFAFIGSCGGMDDTGPGTFSYEFRKGEMVDTVTVGYTGMATCPGWSVALPWQDYMFYAMNTGYTIKDAFELACAEYPEIAPCVVFVGDPTLKVKEEEEEEGEKPIPPTVLIMHPSHGDTVNGTVTVTGTAHHLKGTIRRVYVQIDDSDWMVADGTTSWSYNWDTTTVDDGEHLIRAVSFDGHLYSGCHTIVVYVNNHGNHPPDTPTTPSGPSSGEAGVIYVYSTASSDPDGDDVAYGWDWDGDDSVDEWTGYYPSGAVVEVTHFWNTSGTYHVQVTCRDIYEFGGFSSPLVVNIIGVDNPPNVSVTKPVPGVYLNDVRILPFFAPLILGCTTVEVDVVEKESGVNRVEFYLDDDLKHVDKDEPYMWSWDKGALWRHTIKVVAYDNTGNSAEDEVKVWKLI